MTLPNPETQLSPLLRLYDFLESLGLRVNWRAESPEQPFEQVIVSLDPGSETPEVYEYLVQIAYAEALQAAQSGQQANYTNGATLLFSMVLPLRIPTPLLLEAYRLLALLNRILPFGHLGINEAQEPAWVYFKYALAGLNPGFAMTLVVSVLETLNSFVLQLTPELQSFSQGQQSADESLEKIEALLLKNAHQLFAAMQSAQAPDHAPDQDDQEA